MPKIVIKDELLKKQIEEYRKILLERDIEIEILNSNLEILTNDLVKIGKILGLTEDCSYNDIADKIKKLKQEIERLKKREQECIDHYLVQCKYASEMEDKYITANNIINELEKYLNDLWLDDKGIVLKIRERLQELKGSDEE